VEEGSGESSGDTVESESGRASQAARGAWGKALKLDEMDKFYQVVRKLFLSFSLVFVSLNKFGMENYRTA
jgi:hypothetical protein